MAGESQLSGSPKRAAKRRGALRNRLEYAVTVGAVALLARLPHGLGLRLGAAGGALFGALARALRLSMHRVAVRNLSLAFPEKSESERDAILRSMWRQWGRFAFDCAKITRLTPEELRALVRFDPPERFAALREQAKARGMLILTAHFGSFELLHSAVAANGAPVSLVHRPMANPLFDAFLGSFRARFGTKTMERGHAAREILRELRAGRLVAIPFDQAAKKENRVFLPFLGVLASTNSGLARLALGAGAPVVPVVIVREGDTPRHRVILGKEIEIVRTEDREADVVENSRRFNEALGALLRAQPDHWIWLYRRWKQQPEGFVSPYLDDAPPDEVYRAAAAAAAART